MFYEAKEKGLLLKMESNNIVDEVSFIKEYRNNGLLGCFELNITDENILNMISEELLENGIYCLRIRHNIFVAPPLNINYNVMVETFRKMGNVFKMMEYKLKL